MIYAFRGWIAFVAFMDLGTAVRSYIEKRSFLSEKSNFSAEEQYVDDEYTVSRILGLYSVLKALALIHCTLYIHYKPVVSMGICSMFLTIILYLTETLYFRAATLSFYVIFPCILNAVTLAGLIILPKHLKLWDPPIEIIEDENSQLLKKAGAMKRRRNTRRNN